MTKQADTDKKIAALIKMGEKTLATTKDGHQKQYMDEKMFHDFRISSLSFLTVVFGTKSPFYNEFHKEVTNPTPTRTSRGIGILEGAKKELQGDWLTPVRAEVYGQVERDLLSTARKQVQLGSLLNGLVLATSILENHMQRFASQNNLKIEREVEGKSVPLSAVQLNSRIYKKGLYPRNLNKKIFKWLELKESALTAQAEELTAEQVTEIIDGVAALCVEYPINYLD